MWFVKFITNPEHGSDIKLTLMVLSSLVNYSILSDLTKKGCHLCFIYFSVEWIFRGEVKERGGEIWRFLLSHLNDVYLIYLSSELQTVLLVQQCPVQISV